MIWAYLRTRFYEARPPPSSLGSAAHDERIFADPFPCPRKERWPHVCFFTRKVINERPSLSPWQQILGVTRSPHLALLGKMLFCLILSPPRCSNLQSIKQSLARPGRIDVTSGASPGAVLQTGPPLLSFPVWSGGLASPLPLLSVRSSFLEFFTCAGANNGAVRLNARAISSWLA